MNSPRSSLDIINNHIQRITEIVRQMSTFSRPDSMHIKSHQINDILKSSLDLMRLDKRMKNTIEIAMDLDGDLPGSMIDEGQIAQVFINIILNALDAMPEGGMLTVSTGRGTNDQGRDAVIVEFTDTGIGIPEMELEKILIPFIQPKKRAKARASASR